MTTILIAFVVAVIGAALATWGTIPFARRVMILDLPDGGVRRVHARPVPRAGGLAVLVGFWLPGVILVCAPKRSRSGMPQP